MKNEKHSLKSTEKSGISSNKSMEKLSVKSSEKSAKSSSLKSSKPSLKSEKSSINGKGVQCNLDRKGREKHPH